MRKFAFKFIILLIIVSILINLPLLAVAADNNIGRIKIKVVKPNTYIAVPSVEIYIDGKRVAVTDDNGIASIDNLKYCHYDVKLHQENSNIWENNGFYIKKANDYTVLWYYGQAAKPESLSISSRKYIIVDEPVFQISKRNTLIAINYDASISENTREYIDKLIKDIEPALIKFLGYPIVSSEVTIKYDKSKHVNISQDKTSMTFSRLPDDEKGDPSWDEVFLVNYIHTYLKGRNIPIQGVRYAENLAHSIKEIVAEHLKNKGIRDISHKGMDYYINAYPAFKALNSGIVLNQGTSSQKGVVFDGYNFLFSEDAYNKLNPFTIEYAKSVWLKIAYARYLKEGTLDFFYRMKEELYDKNPQTRDDFEGIMESIVSKIDGSEIKDWMKEQALFKGRIDNAVTIDMLIVKGNMNNVFGRNNPDYIYPFVMFRSPARLLDIDVAITIKDPAGNIVLNKNLKSGYDGEKKTNISVPKEKFKPGLYTVIVKGIYNGKKIRNEQEFQIFDEAAIDGYWMNINNKGNSRDTKITINYDKSLPLESRKYIEKLVEIIDPAIRKIAGEPQANQTLLIKYDPDGLNSMNGNMTELNIKYLPKTNNGSVDANFDSFFYIEYYHMFHRNTHIPIENIRYNENISQAMKIVIASYLSQYDLRQSSVKTIPYYIKLHSILDGLGPGILLNLGIKNANQGNSKENTRAQWDDTKKFAQMMNYFTLEYGPATWLKLADAYY